MRVVIIGGSYGGFAVAKALEKQFNDKVEIIIVERRTHFYHAVGGLRAAVLGLDDQVFIPYDKLFKLSTNKVIHAKAIHFDEKSVTLDKSVDGFGDSINFDFLILATGTLYPSPAKIYADTLEEGKTQLNHIQQQVKEARNILIIGGGPVGIEFAGEIIDKYKDEKKITLIHNNDQLGQASYLNKKANKNLLSILKSNNVKVLLNDRVDLPSTSDSVFQPKEPLPKTKNGVDLNDIDLVLLAFGNRPNVSLVQESYPDAIHENGYVKVKPSLQIDHPSSSLSKNVFVIGDAAALDENKMAFHTIGHSAVVTENISRLVKNPSTTDLKQYKNNIDAIIIPFGKKQGVSQLPLGIVAGNWFTSLLKGKTLFYDRYWKEFNQPVPR
ncbi:hypothetical protein BJ944DRAFT_165810 [Cunninghamella echinulata]|nr:hypothetical protein BJ944DRAFT_165810 [Cunninghamella echinulata]